MVIRQLAIRNFGKIHESSLELKPGINVLYGENESGKTTIHTFIRSMFYGLQRSRGRGARKDSYTKYEPWENPSDFGGSLWFEEDGKTYRLTRSFSRDYASEELYCETDGENLDLDEGELDRLLGGVSEMVYENTVSVAQLKSVTGKELIQELQNYMVSYQGTGDTSVDLGKAVQMLKMTRKGYSVQEERQNRIRYAEQNKIQAQYAHLQQELNSTKQKKAALEEKNELERNQVRTERKTAEKMLSDLAESKKMLTIAGIFTAVIPILLAMIFYVAVPALSFMSIFPLLIGGAGLLLEYLNSKKLKEEENEIRRHLKVLKKQEDKRIWDEEQISELLNEKQQDLENIGAELKEYEVRMREESQARIEVDALTLAMDTMEDLTRQFRTRVGLGLRKRTSEILSEITDGKYDKVLIDYDFRIQINTEDKVVPLESLSRGTLEQIYFALRMAAGELLCGDTQLPVILDDVFGMYDEERLAAVLRWLNKEPRQVIISTCNKREMEILKRENIAYHEVLLGTE